MEIHIETLENNITKVLISTEKKNSNQPSGEIELDIQTQSKFIETIDSLLKNRKTNKCFDKLAQIQNKHMAPKGQEHRHPNSKTSKRYVA